MTPEQWQQIRNLFESAELLSGAAREEFLENECAGNAELREEVDSMLRAAAEAGSTFMDRPAADWLPTANEDAAVETRIGRLVGPYKIIAEIGHGGMGEVYRAERIDGQFDQQVAIKLVRGHGICVRRGAFSA